MSLVFSFLKPITALCFVVSLFACTAFNTNIDGVVVTTSHGQVRGADAGNVISFKGIRYAAPSIGDNRWREPQPLENWDGVVDATQYGSDCMQKPFPSDAAPLGEIPKEDCLFVNIWKPEKFSATKKLPVIVWIYGGGFVNGGSSPAVYDGSEFAKSDVIFVSFNYRLGRFGFFSHPALTSAAEGKLANFAIMDQIAALRWVKENIANFGGDPGQVTIMGESAGGSSVHYLLETPLAEGLFQRAIIMSGGSRFSAPLRSIDEGKASLVSAEEIGLNFAKHVGVEGSGPEALQKLRELPAEKIISDLNLASLFSGSELARTTYLGGPVLDEKVVVGSTRDLLARGKVTPVPVLVGVTSADIGFSMAQSKDELFAQFGANADKARQLYDPSGHIPLIALKVIVGQDFLMQEPARFTAAMMSKLGMPSYMYRFSYVAESIRNGRGAQHATDIPYFFNTVDEKYGEALTKKDQNAAEDAHQYFVNFAKNGNPNSEGLPVWEVFDSKKSNLMDFTLGSGPVHGADIWRDRLDLVEKAMSQ